MDVPGLQPFPLDWILVEQAHEKLAGVTSAIEPGCRGQPCTVSEVGIVRSDNRVNDTWIFGEAFMHDALLAQVPKEVTQGSVRVGPGMSVSTAGEHPGDVDSEGRERLAGAERASR